MATTTRTTTTTTATIDPGIDAAAETTQYIVSHTRLLRLMLKKEGFSYDWQKPVSVMPVVKHLGSVLRKAKTYITNFKCCVVMLISHSITMKKISSEQPSILPR